MSFHNCSVLNSLQDVKYEIHKKLFISFFLYLFAFVMKCIYLENYWKKNICKLLKTLIIAVNFAMSDRDSCNA